MSEREPGRETLFGVSGPEWPAAFWLFAAQMTVEGARVVIEGRGRDCRLIRWNGWRISVPSCRTMFWYRRG